MPFPMAGQPLHAAAEAPMAWAARHDHAVELMLAHFPAQRIMPARIFLLREMVVDRVAVIRRVVHVRERRILVEARSHLVPAEVGQGLSAHLRLPLFRRYLELSRSFSKRGTENPSLCSSCNTKIPPGKLQAARL